MNLDRLPPFSAEAEQGILGCILLNPQPCLNQCVEALKSGMETFYDLRHQTIYGTMLAMQEALVNVDVTTLAMALKDRQRLDEVGGITYLAALPEASPSAQNLPYYLEIVQEKFLLRKMMQTLTESAGKIYDWTESADSLLDTIERDVMAVRNLRSSRKNESMKSLVGQAIDLIESYHQKKGAYLGLETGLGDLDKMTGGLMEGEMTVVAGFPGTGKTSLALNIAEHVSVSLKAPVGLFSMEMTGKQLVVRMLCSKAQVNLKNIREGFMSERDFPKLTLAAGKLQSAPIYLDDESDCSIHQLRAKARRMVQQFGIKLFVVDYLQLLNAAGGSRKAESRQQEVSDISRGLKGIALELKVPVLALSQLNDDGRLRESRAIGQDADNVWILKQGEATDEQSTSQLIPVTLDIQKQRNGPTGGVNLLFLKSITRFEIPAKVNSDDMPRFSNSNPHPD